MFKNLKIFHKLAVSYFLIAAIAVIVLSFIFYTSFKEALLERTSAQLSSINILKKSQIEKYIDFRKANLTLISTDPAVVQLINSFVAGDTNSNRTYYNKEYLKKIFSSNRYPSYCFLDKNGNFLVTSENSCNLNNLLIDPLRNKKFQEFIKSSRSKFSLFDGSEISKTRQTILLLGIPVFSNGIPSGILIVERKFDEIQDILFERTGMGETGESYIVAGDFKMRSPSRFFPNKNPLSISVKTTASIEAFNGNSKKTISIIKDYRSVEVLSFYRKLQVPDLQWVLISEIDFEEILKPVYRIRNYIIITGIILVILIFLITILLSKIIAQPIVKLNGIILQLSKGIFPPSLSSESKDEIGEMTNAIDHLIDGLKRTTGFAHEIGSGNFKVNFTPLSSEDDLGASLLQMRDRLKELKIKEAGLMRERSSALLEGQEKERRRISQELHDGIGQLLTVIRFKMAVLEGHETFKSETKALLDETITEVRRISNNVMPSVLLDFGLEAALKNLCNTITKFTGVKVDYDYQKIISSEINFEISVSLYRIAQEALNNIVKHSGANIASLIIVQSEDTIFMEINDNGEGFDIMAFERSAKLSNGLKNMQERVNILQGIFKINSEKDLGTTISVEIPLLIKVI